MLDAIHGKTWMLRRVADGKPTWLPIQRIESEKEAAQAWQKSSDNSVKAAKTEQSQSLDAFLKERGYVGISLNKLKTGLLCLEQRIEGKKVFLAVDTGSAYTYLEPLTE
jgi:predicted aspartyl protease